MVRCVAQLLDRRSTLTKPWPGFSTSRRSICRSRDMSCVCCVEEKAGGKAAKKNKRKKKPGSAVHQAEMTHSQALMSLCAGYYKVEMCAFRHLTIPAVDAGVVVCLEWGADLHMAQQMPLPLTVSCFSKIQIGFTFLVPAHLGSPGKRAVKRLCVCAVDADCSTFLTIKCSLSTHLFCSKFSLVPIMLIYCS